MATLTETNLTMADHAQRTDPTGVIPAIVELLEQKNPAIKHAIFQEGNLTTGHRFIQRVAEPTVGLRELNQGTVPSKSRTEPVTEDCSIIEAWSEVDEEVAKLNGQIQRTRWSEDISFISAMNKKFFNLLFYGDPASNALEYRGLANRYNSLSGDNSDNIVVQASASGTDCMSAFFCVWGDQTMYGIFPKGQKAGLDVEDLGLETKENATTGALMRVYRTHFMWKVGLALKDWRYVSRAQLDKSVMDASADGMKAAVTTLIKAYHRVNDWQSGVGAIYVGRTCYEYLHLAVIEKVASSTLKIVEDLERGRPIMTFLGVPIYMCEGLLATETAIS